jgi:integrase
MSARPRRPKGLGSVEELPSGTFRARIYLPEKRERTFAKRGDATTWLEFQAAARSAQRAGRQSPGTNPRARISTVRADYLEALRAERAEPKTVAGAGSHLEQVVARYGDLLLVELEGPRLSRMIRDLAKTGLAASTIRNRISSLTSLARWAMREGLIPERAIVVRRPRVELDSRPDAYSEDDAAALVEAAASLPDPRYLAAVQLASRAGLRGNEVQRLRGQDVNVRARTVFVGKSKTHRPRTVPIPAELVAALQACGLEHGRLVVGRETWRAGQNLARFLDPVWIRAELGLRSRLHRLRHTWATRLARSGATMWQVAEWGGWATLSQVRRYFHGLDVRDRGPVDSMD